MRLIISDTITCGNLLLQTANALLLAFFLQNVKWNPFSLPSSRKREGVCTFCSKKKCRYISFLRVPICHTLRVPQSCLRARSTLPPPTAAAAARFISDALLNKSMKVSSCAGCFFFIQRGLTGLHLKVLRHIYERKCNTFVVPCRPFFFFSNMRF